MVSTSTFMLKNRFIPRTRGRARTRAARDFLKTIEAIPELETNDALNSKRKMSFIPFFVGDSSTAYSLVLTLLGRDSYQDSTHCSTRRLGTHPLQIAIFRGNSGSQLSPLSTLRNTSLRKCKLLDTLVQR